jgi:hypothetical protein
METSAIIVMKVPCSDNIYLLIAIKQKSSKGVTLIFMNCDAAADAE